MDQAADKLRSQQLVRARITWSTQPGITIPVVAVSRVSGQFFAFVAEQKDGKDVARQIPLTLGEISGNDYTVLSGLKPGDRGHRVRRAEPGRRHAHQDPAVAHDFQEEGALALFADFFIKRPVFSTVTSLFIVIAGAVCIPLLPIAQFPELAPPHDRGQLSSTPARMRRRSNRR